MNATTQERSLQRVIPGYAASDGAGVRLKRSIGAQPGLRFDPFLLLDEFSSEDPNDYLAGFPAHPHRGFETVTVMLEGRMRHEDDRGNRGDLGPGDVQWMTAARGIIHSEMPQQDRGRMHGFQLWINLPAADKMRPAAWRDVPAASIPRVALVGGGEARVIAGELLQGEQRTPAAVSGGATAPVLLDLQLTAGSRHQLRLPVGHAAFIYPYAGELRVGMEQRPLAAGHAGLLSDGEVLKLTAGAEPAQLLVLAARPLHEPVVQYGPFVMNTREEIEQALADYREGRLAA